MIDDAFEEWRPIDGWPYEVSSFGRVRRVGAASGTVSGRILKPAIKRDGYETVMLKKRPLAKVARVHRLVCAAFNGPPPPGKTFACHADGNKLNNRSSNLRWDSQEGNLADTIPHGTRARGEMHGACKISRDTMVEIVARVAGGEDRRAVAAAYGIHKNYLDQVLRGARRNFDGLTKDKAA